MLHWEMPARLSFKTWEMVVPLKVYLVEMELPSHLMDNPFAQAQAQLQAQVLAQSSRESTMLVKFQIMLQK